MRVAFIVLGLCRYMSGFTTEFEGGTCVAFLFNGVALDSRAKYIAGLVAAVPPRA